MEAANHHLNIVTPHHPANINRAWELIALHTDEADETLQPVSLKSADETLKGKDRVDLVIDLEFEIYAWTEDLQLACVEGEAVQSGRRVCRYPAAPPLDDVTVVVVVRGLDQRDQELFPIRDLPGDFRLDGDLDSPKQTRN